MGLYGSPFTYVLLPVPLLILRNVVSTIWLLVSIRVWLTEDIFTLDDDGLWVKTLFDFTTLNYVLKGYFLWEHTMFRSDTPLDPKS